MPNIKKIIAKVLRQEAIQETTIGKELNEASGLANEVAHYFSNPSQEIASRQAVSNTLMQIIALLKDAKKHDANVGKLSQRLWGWVQSKGPLSQEDSYIFQSANKFSNEVDYMVTLVGRIILCVNKAASNNLSYLSALSGGRGNANLEDYFEEIKLFRDFSGRLEGLRSVLSRMFYIEKKMAETIK